jgi:glycosyltransferase involved in cell wall biosynthesis
MRPDLRIGYVPYSADLQHPGDRRRFCFWAGRRGVDFEVARPGRRYDLVVLSARADLTYWAKAPSSTRVVYDLIDSYLAIRPHDPRDMARGIGKFALRQHSRPALSYRRAVVALCRRADAVVCTTVEQQATISPYNSNVHVVLDHHPMTFRPKDDYARGPELRLVWEGLPHTLGGFASIAPVLEEIAAQQPLMLTLITDLRYARLAGSFLRADTATLAESVLRVPHRLVPWSEDNLVREAPRADIAVIPLDAGDAFARGKPENKLLLLWRMGLPTVTTATPAYDRAMAAAGLDLTCTTTGEWATRLAALAGDESARANAGRAGRAFVETAHSAAARLADWDRVIDSVLG